jgi:hypothetical protein
MCFAPVDAGADAPQDVTLDASPEASADVSDGFSGDLDPRCTNPPFTLFCGSGCHNPLTSNTNCGRCGNACVAPETCFMGRCARP